MQGFNFPHGGEPSSVGRNLFGGPDQTDSLREGTAAAAQPDLRRGLADLKAASADGSLRRACPRDAVWFCSQRPWWGARWAMEQLHSASKWRNAATSAPDIAILGDSEHVSVFMACMSRALADALPRQQ